MDKKKVGRPKTPKNQAKTVLRGTLLGPQEVKEIDLKIKDSGLDNSKWIREAMFHAAKNQPEWVKSKWTAEQLHERDVEFRLTAPNFAVSGIGRFRAHGGPLGKIRVQIVVPKGPDIGENIYSLYQQSADKIEQNPDLKIAEFRLLG